MGKLKEKAALAYLLTIPEVAAAAALQRAGKSKDAKAQMAVAVKYFPAAVLEAARPTPQLGAPGSTPTAAAAATTLAGNESGTEPVAAAAKVGAVADVAAVTEAPEIPVPLPAAVAPAADASSMASNSDGEDEE